MSTQIKKNGNWVTVAGGTRMWVGTKAALQAALDAGELVDGTAVMVTDDYEEGNVEKTFFTPVVTSGSPLASDCWYMRKGNIVTVNIGIASYSGFTANAFTLPAGLRPAGRVFAQASGNTAPCLGSGMIYSEGDIELNTPVADGGFFATWTYTVVA